MAPAEESTLPEAASRDNALQMVRAYVSNIALLMNAIELGLTRKDQARRLGHCH